MTEETERKPQVIKVSVDSTQMKQLVETTSEQEKEIKELKEQIEGSQEAQELLTDMKEKASVELTALGVDTDVENLKTKADLDRAIVTIQRLKAKKSTVGNQGSGGSAPLNSQQFGRTEIEGFENMTDLINNLNDRASASNKNESDRKLAVQQREQLLRKVFKGQKQLNRPLSFEGSDILEFRKAQFQRRKKLAKGET